MKSISIICLVSLIFLLQNCSSGTFDDADKKENAHDTLLLKWKSDSSGCIGLRTADNARLLFKRYELQSKTPGEIISLLGKPNKTLGNGTGLSLDYFFDTKCGAGKIIDSIEHCSASFFYIDKTKRDCSLSTPCQ